MVDSLAEGLLWLPYPKKKNKRDVHLRNQMTNDDNPVYDHTFPGNKTRMKTIILMPMLLFLWYFILLSMLLSHPFLVDSFLAPLLSPSKSSSRRKTAVSFRGMALLRTRNTDHDDESTTTTTTITTITSTPSISTTIPRNDDDESTTTRTQELSTTSTSSSSHIVFPGGGIFFYYQAGIVNYLRENGYDLSQCSFSGASAGALTATLTATEVDFYEATDLALDLAAQAGVWNRSSGLQGIWGPMIEEWLDTLLPPTTTSMDSVQGGRLTLLVTPVVWPRLGKTKISNFIDRQDLIKCNMASVHLPWFLDGKLTCNFRNEPHIDGSFLSKAEDYIPHNNNNNNSGSKTPQTTIVLDWKKDPVMNSKGGMDIVKAMSPDGIYGLLEQGKAYGKTLDEQGVFDSLKKVY